MKNLKIFVILILLLSLPNLLGASAVSACRLAGLGGTQPKEACQLRDFLENFERLKNSKIPNAYVFYGETGTGKSVGTEIMAQESKAEIIMIHISQILLKDNSDKKNSGIEEIKKAYEKAEEINKKENKPILIIIEELEIIKSCNKSNLSEAAQAIVTELIEQLKKYKNNSSIITILVTNRMDGLDKGLAYRCHHVEWPLPGEENRKAILWKYMNVYPHELTDNLIKTLPSKTKGLTGRDILFIFEKASFNARYRNANYINNNDFEDALESRLKSVSYAQSWGSWIKSWFGF